MYQPDNFVPSQQNFVRTHVHVSVTLRNSGLVQNFDVDHLSTREERKDEQKKHQGRCAWEHDVI